MQAELELFAADHSARAILGERAYHAALEARVLAVREAERQLRALVPSSAVAPSRDEWAELDTSERRLVLASMIDAVFIRKACRRKILVERRAFIAWRGSGWDGEDELPRRGRVNGPIRPAAWPIDDNAEVRMATL